MGAWFKGLRFGGASGANDAASCARGQGNKKGSLGCLFVTAQKRRAGLLLRAEDSVFCGLRYAELQNGLCRDLDFFSDRKDRAGLHPND